MARGGRRLTGVWPELAGVGVGDGEMVDGDQQVAANTVGNSSLPGVAPFSGSVVPNSGADGRSSEWPPPMDLDSGAKGD